MKKLVQFGAGNIGRSFLGQLFARSGYEVVFVDIDERLVEGLNRERKYRVMIKQTDKPDESLVISNVRAVNGKDTEAVAREIAEADILATSVGQRALPVILKVISEGLKLRREQYGERALDIIIAENMHGAGKFFEQYLSKLLPGDYPLDKLVGLVETSIGKMVPIMREKDLEEDPLWVFAEPYNELILDKLAFKNPIPDVAGLAPKNNMKAYVDRKLFIHNLGHAATAYFGYQLKPTLIYTYEVLDIAEVFEKARQSMMQSAKALIKEYPEELKLAELIRHVDDLLVRFRNKALGDTVYRVGRDLYRKLGKNDRLIGAMLLGQKHECEMDEIARAVVAGVHFRGRDEKGHLFADDRRFVVEEFPQGLEHILTSVSGLNWTDPIEAQVIKKILRVACPEGHI